MVMAGSGEGAAAARDRLPALWRRIERAHYSYLETDDSPEKIRQREKLEGYIVEYLSLVPHECKFGLAETGKVFARTVAELAEFSAYRAGLGWAALGRYAANLLAQPWRKEYKEIRLYSGYYKHEVEANLVGGECLLRAMGYRAARAGRLAMVPPLCPDTVAAVSRDALVAQAECQMMAQIWEAVWRGGRRVSWAAVWRERVARAGDVAQAAARLAAAHDDADAPYMDGSEVYSNVPVTIPEALAPDARYNHGMSQTPCNQNYAETSIDEPVNPMVQYVVPNMMPPMCPIAYPHMPDMGVPTTQMGVQMVTPYGVPYYYPVQTPYLIPTPVYAPIKHAATIPVNGYHPVSQYRYPAVPTAQLIELDTPPVFENGTKHGYKDEERHKRRLPESPRRNSTSKSGFSDVSLPSLPRSDTQPALSKAREDGMGTYESWDYVFRNLSSKNGDDRNRYSPSYDRDSRTLDRLDRDERRSKYQPTTLDLEDGLQAMSLDRTYDEDAYRTAKVNENLMRLKQEQEKKARQLKKATEPKRKIEPVANPPADALVATKVAPDKVKLLTKKDVKDRKEVIKQQSFVNGSTPSAADARKIKKPAKLLPPEGEKTHRPLENGHATHLSKSAASFPSQPYDLKAQLIVSLDEPDSRQSPPKLNGDSSHSQPNGIRKSPLPKDKWQCGTCTYLNQGTVQACEMCGKSKKGVEIQPLTSGGRECPACTLVNQRDARICDACGTSLEHCPTYI